MKLDTRILEGRRPLTCYDVESAKRLIGSKGYFSCGMSFFSDLDNLCLRSTLKSVSEDANPFNSECKNFYYPFFLPEEFCSSEEEKYRPYSFDEWNVAYKIGDIIKFRQNNDNAPGDISVLYLGFCKFIDGEVTILLGNIYYEFQDLFDNYEIYDSKNQEWKPFGVKSLRN